MTPLILSSATTDPRPHIVAMCGINPIQPLLREWHFFSTNPSLLTTLLTFMAHIPKCLLWLIDCSLTFNALDYSCTSVHLMPMVIAQCLQKQRPCTSLSLQRHLLNLMLSRLTSSLVTITNSTSLSWIASNAWDVAHIHKSLCNDIKITHHLKQASQQAAALQNFWNSSADLQTK